MKIAISATNPCHLYELAVALHEIGQLGTYHSGYPRWRLRPPSRFPLRAHATRTVITYGFLKLPSRLRPAAHRLFRWQDTGFDRAVAADLSASDGDLIHALPGQARDTFRRARMLGIKTVLNHASGPVRQQLALIAPEYARAGVALDQLHGFDETYFKREAEEYQLADFHCVASGLVKQQLINEGVPETRIWVAPYAADPTLFFPADAAAKPGIPRILFAGQLTLRKGIRTLVEAFQLVRASRPVELHLYGAESEDLAGELAQWKTLPDVRFSGAVSRGTLAEAFRNGSLLVLPSWEEAFGLVVPQALNCGLPCIVSDRVGAGDLITESVNGSVFSAGDAPGLAERIHWWLDHPDAFNQSILTWEGPARLIAARTSEILTRP